jgi:hypothetical protein
MVEGLRQVWVAGAMIPVHMEPKGLAPDAKPVSAKYAQIAFYNDAINGSRRLRDAILFAKGIVPPDDGPPATITLPRRERFKARKPTKCCPLCGSHKWNGARRISVAHIQAEVADFYGLPIMEMTSKRRAHKWSHPRQVAMYLARELTPQSLPEIGYRFGGRDHTTVMHAISAVEERIANDPELALDVETIRERLAL